ncbi:thiol reductant ABC exporter subunit CydC [Alicyclobacillus sp. ALC3]|uniref:thiol reductant ABC exporter subunit CydC n=1 Tax=Alicyclobacillus sp. ALC3 TaxID=2796143 RepID=UPI002377D8BE|nr:thiol reductant ABC exporter subunit CydC [Alicyclobacillus sp. ALC3]WDL95934.1 thiol reductant ABC exporter subunit CydC [Alicyclobacillus sp. ALC3]
MKTALTLWQFFAPYKLRMALSVLLGFLTVGASIGLMATSGYLIASAALHPTTILLLWVPIVGVRFFGISRAVFRYLERYVSHDLTFRILSRLRIWLYQRVEPAAPASLQNAQGGDVLSTLTSDVDTLQNLYLRVVAPPIVALLTLFLMYAIVSHWSISIAQALVVASLLTGVGVPLLTLQLSKRDSAGTIQSRAEIYARVTESVHGMTEIITFGQTEAVLRRLEGAQWRLSQRQLRLSHVSGLATGLSTFFQNAAAWVVLLLAIPLVNTRHLTGVSLTALVLTALASFEAVMPLTTVFQSFGQSMEAAKRVFRLAAKQPVTEEPACTDVTPSPLPTSFDLSFAHVTFRYPNRGRYTPGNQIHESSLSLPCSASPAVLTDVTFELPHGKHIAIVGPSGAGKSTLLQLLVRFWEYQGSIRLGGRELREYRSETVRNLITVVLQQPYLFHTSIAENLRIARPDATAEDLMRALDAVKLTDLVVHLPEGLNTLVGEQGATLSGGERQRVALARAFLQAAPIWVLDEATSGLDAVTEEDILSTVLDSCSNRSLILITHRLVGLDRMDEILVMDGGSILEHGSHTDLLAQNGLYRAMWEMNSLTI